MAASVSSERPLQKAREEITNVQRKAIRSDFSWAVKLTPKRWHHCGGTIAMTLTSYGGDRY